MDRMTKIVSSHTTDSKPVKQEVNGTVILSHLVFPGQTYQPSTEGSFVVLSAAFVSMEDERQLLLNQLRLDVNLVSMLYFVFTHVDQGPVL
jgi:hypothetical protein